MDAKPTQREVLLWEAGYRQYCRAQGWKWAFVLAFVGNVVQWWASL